MGYNEELNAALTMFNVKPENEIEKVLCDIKNRYPDKFEPYFYLGTIEIRRGNFNKAAQFMEKTLDISPIPSAFKLLGLCYITINKYKEAIDVLKNAIIYNPYDIEIQQQLARLCPNLNFIDKTKKNISGVYNNSYEAPNVKYLKVYDAYIKERKMPTYCDSQLTNEQKILIENANKIYKTSNIKEGFVAEVQNGMVFAKQSDQSYIFASDDKLLKDLIDIKSQPLSTSKLPSIINLCDNLLVLSSAYGGNFYHWLTWTIPRLKMIFDQGYRFEDFDRILINYIGFKFQHELIDLLNIPKDKIIGTLPNGALMKAKKIVTASLPEHYYTPNIVISSLREFFLKENYISKDYPKKIYLSRNKSKSRYVLNENEVVEFLKEYDFKIIYAEDLSFIEQIKYFVNAEIIISQHGAGLVNLAFCNENTKVIEIFNEKMKNYLDIAYWQISNDLNLKHYIMFGEPIGQAGAMVDMNIDIKKLKELFELAQIDKK